MTSDFVKGLFVGGGVVFVGMLLYMMFQIKTALISIVQSVVALSVSAGKQERALDATMQAVGNIVDAIRLSQLPPPDRFSPPRNPTDISDLRRAFEDGVDGLEDDLGDEDDEDSNGEWRIS